MSTFGNQLHANTLTGDFKVSATKEFTAYGPGNKLLSIHSTDTAPFSDPLKEGDVEVDFTTDKPNGLKFMMKNLPTAKSGLDANRVYVNTITQIDTNITTVPALITELNTKLQGLKVLAQV